MDSQEFREQINEAHGLMSEEKYKDAITILEKLKKYDKEGDFDYTLTHRLYQLLSNSYSLYNQQIILKAIEELAESQKSISLKDLHQNLIQKNEFEIEEPILIREIELLILRNALKCRLDGNTLKF